MGSEKPTTRRQPRRACHSTTHSTSYVFAVTKQHNNIGRSKSRLSILRPFSATVVLVVLVVLHCRTNGVSVRSLRLAVAILPQPSREATSVRRLEFSFLCSILHGGNSSARCRRGKARTTLRHGIHRKHGQVMPSAAVRGATRETDTTPGKAWDLKMAVRYTRTRTANKLNQPLVTYKAQQERQLGAIQSK